MDAQKQHSSAKLAIKVIIREIINCISYLAKNAVYVSATGYITRMVKVLHNRIEPDSYFLVFLQITASKLGVFLTEGQWLLRLKRRFIVQTLGMRVPPSGLEEQDQHVENEVSNECKVQFLDLWGHDELFLSPRHFHEWWIKGNCVYVRVRSYITRSLCQ